MSSWLFIQQQKSLTCRDVLSGYAFVKRLHFRFLISKSQLTLVQNTTTCGGAARSKTGHTSNSAARSSRVTFGWHSSPALQFSKDKLLSFHEQVSRLQLHFFFNSKSKLNRKMLTDESSGCTFTEFCGSQSFGHVRYLPSLHKVDGLKKMPL